MDAIILRTLTEKSTLGVGKYSYLRVGDMLKAEKQPYLRWMYFNIAGISFSEQVLNSIGVDEDMRITKPGTNPGKEQEIYAENLENASFFLKSHLKRRHKYQTKANVRSARYSVSFSKAELQAINQNKK